MNPEALSQRMIDAMKRYVTRSHEGMLARLDEFDKRIKAIPAGPEGKIGPPGIGLPGEPGRDGAELEILPSIDETRSYRRGTWASHRGGLIKAGRQTDPVQDGNLLQAGWMVMVEGLAAIVPSQDPEDSAKFRIATMLTSGTTITTDFVVAFIEWKGIWKAGEKYRKGHLVTHAGSGWHCNVDNTKETPGMGTDWTLINKRGRDGKDFNGGDPPKGPVRLK